MDYRLGRVPATLYYDARYPTRTQQFSARELRLILSQLHRPSVLRGQHFYPFDSDPNYAQWFNEALDMIVQSLLPPPVQLQPPTQPLPPTDDLISPLSQSTVLSGSTPTQDTQLDQYLVSLDQTLPSDLFDTGYFSLQHQRQPIVFQEGADLRLWFSPTRRSEDIHLSTSVPQEELAHLVETGQTYLGCAVWISSLPVNLCRPDGSCVSNWHASPSLNRILGPCLQTPPGTFPLRNGCLYYNRPLRSGSMVGSSPRHARED